VIFPRFGGHPERREDAPGPPVCLAFPRPYRKVGCALPSGSHEIDAWIIEVAGPRYRQLACARISLSRRRCSSETTSAVVNVMRSMGVPTGKWNHGLVLRMWLGLRIRARRLIVRRAAKWRPI
jgi:hypothetical protein